MQIDDFDPIDLAEKAGATQLLTENADFYAQLVRCSALVGSLKPRPEDLFKASDYAWRDWINSKEPMERAAEIAGDPHEGLFPAEVACFGGGYLTIPSDNAEDPFILGALLEAVFKGRDETKPHFVNDVAEIALLGLWISDQCIRRAGLNRCSVPGETSNGDVRWPSGGEARILQSAVRFDEREVGEKLRSLGVGIGGLHSLGFRQGEISAEYHDYLANPVRTKPLLVAEGQIVVISPGSILGAIRNAILKKAEEYDVRTWLTATYRHVMQDRVDECATLQEWDFRGRTEVSLAGTTVGQAFYQFDTDKLAIIYTICDDLQHGSKSLEQPYWGVKHVFAALDEHLPQVESLLLKGEPPPAALLHVIAFQGIGRPFVAGISFVGTDVSLTVCLSIDEFYVFTLLNLNDSHALWQVASARHELKQTKIVGAGFLDHYELYRRRDKSYYFSDEGVPDLVMFLATGMQVRLDAQQKVDVHIAQFSQRDRYGRVARLLSRPNLPIYTSLVDDSRIQLLIEGLPFTTWVVASATDHLDIEKHHALYFHLIDAIAFWLWQVTPSLNECLARIVDPPPPSVTISVEVIDPESWFDPHGDVAQDTGIHATIVTGNGLELSFSPEYGALSARSDNYAERVLLKSLLRQLSLLLRFEITDAQIERILAEHAPLGVKRRFAIMQGALADLLNTGGLPRVRLVQKFDESVVVGMLGRHLRTSGLMQPDTISEERRQMVANEAVRFLYEGLRTVVGRIAAPGLLESLVARHEALLAHRKQLEVTIASHLAWFGHTDSEITDLETDVTSCDKASMASRFIIEFTTTQPPNGRQSISKSAYDRALALSAEIAYFGRMSDSLKYGLSNHAFQLLKSDRLVLSDPHFETTMIDFQHSFYSRMAGAAVKRAADTSDRTTSPSAFQRADTDELETASAAEFGFPLSKLCDVLSFIAASPFTEGNGVGKSSKRDLVAFLENHAELDAVAIADVLEFFSLRPRKEFLAPPAPFDAQDVYPWRFNRRLSYLRRPLLVEGNDDLIWGRRALHQAVDYLVGLCITGKVKNPQSSAMRKLKGRIVDRIGAAFNDRVANLLGDNSGILVKRRMKKIGGKRIRRDTGDDLGDIDVLALRADARQILAIETKCFSFAKTPIELANERDELFGDLKSNSGAIHRHLERVEWLRTNIRAVLTEFKWDMTDVSAWHVIPLLVLDTDLVTPRLLNPRLKIIPIDDLMDWLSTASIR